MKKFLKRSFKIMTFTAVAILCCTLLASCSQTAGTIFGTYYQLDVWGSNSTEAVNSATERLKELDDTLSPSISTSDVSKLNAAAANVAISVSTDTIYLFELSKILYEKTNGAYNPAIFPIVELWGFDPKNFGENKTKVPSAEEIAAILPICDFNNFVLDKAAKTITKTVSSAKLDFGASAKGYAADAAAKYMYEHTDFQINIGGTVLIGQNAKTIGILKPFTEKDILKVLTITKAGIATSGSYIRKFEKDGKLYHHIIGKDGYPTGINTQNPVISATVSGGAGVISDMLSTVGLLLPQTEFETLLKSYNASALLVLKDNTEIMLNNFELLIQK